MRHSCRCRPPESSAEAAWRNPPPILLTTDKTQASLRCGARPKSRPPGVRYDETKVEKRQKTKEKTKEETHEEQAAASSTAPKQKLSNAAPLPKHSCGPPLSVFTQLRGPPPAPSPDGMASARPQKRTVPTPPPKPAQPPKPWWPPTPPIAKKARPQQAPTNFVTCSWRGMRWHRDSAQEWWVCFLHMF